jgi:hypothetical protein
VEAVLGKVVKIGSKLENTFQKKGGETHMLYCMMAHLDQKKVRNAHVDMWTVPSKKLVLHTIIILAIWLVLV